MKKRLILSSIATIALFSSIAIGGTYALFTSESTTTINVSSGKVNFTSDITDIKTYSLGKLQEGTTFENGGSVAYDKANGTFNITNITPGDKVTFNFNIKNNSTVKTAYRISVKTPYQSNIFHKALVYSGIKESASGWTFFDIPGSEEERLITKPISIELPETVTDSKLQGKKIDFVIKVEAIQFDAFSMDDFAPLEVDKEKKVVNIKGYNSYLEFTQVMSEWNSDWGKDQALLNEKQFKGYTVNLLNDIDVRSNTLDKFVPIGHYKKLSFAGTFDGHGHTISNFVCEDANQSLGYGAGTGIFASTKDGATIKNLNVHNITLKGDLHAGAIVGHAQVSNIIDCKVTGDVKISGRSYLGAIVGKGYYNLTNCDVEASEISYVNGSYIYVGGVYGFNGEGNFLIKDCDSNINATGLSYVGGLGGLIHYGNTIDNCHVKANVRKTILTSDQPDESDKYGIGGIAGIHVYNEAPTNISTIKNSSFIGKLINDFDPNTDWTKYHNGLLGVERNFDGTNIKEKLDISTNNTIELVK